MRMLSRSRVLRTNIAAIVAVAMIIGSAAGVAAKPPPKPSPIPSPSIAIAIAPAGTLEPSGEYANVDVTVTCPVGSLNLALRWLSGSCAAGSGATPFWNRSISFLSQV